MVQATHTLCVELGAASGSGISVVVVCYRHQQTDIILYFRRELCLEILIRDGPETAEEQDMGPGSHVHVQNKPQAERFSRNMYDAGRSPQTCQRARKPPPNRREEWKKTGERKGSQARTSAPQGAEEEEGNRAREGGPPTDRGRRGASKPGEQPSRGTEAGRAETATRTTAPASRSPRPETLGRGLGTETRALGVRPSAPQRGPGRLCGNSLRGWEACQAGGLGPPERQDATAGGQKQGHYHPRNLLFCAHMDSQAAGTTAVPGGAGAGTDHSSHGQLQS